MVTSFNLPVQPLLVTGAIIPEKGRILVAQRHTYSRFEPSKWEFPGGKVDFGEHPENALKRELKEEVGITIETGPVYEILSHVYENDGDMRHVVLLFYLCRITNGDPKPIDCQDLRWVEKKEMKSLPFVEGDIPLVEQIISDSGLWDSDLRT